MATNIRALRERDEHNRALNRYYKIACLFTDNGRATADAGVEWVRQVIVDLQIPPLRTYGIQTKHVADIVTKAMNASSMKANPIALTPEELTETLRLAL